LYSREEIHMEIEKEKICNKRLSVFCVRHTKETKKYLIGVQISKLLQRQTFNLYRSLKLKGVEVSRASPQEIGFLLRTRTVPQNTHSVSLVQYEGGKKFLLENFKGPVEPEVPRCSMIPPEDSKELTRSLFSKIVQNQVHRASPYPELKTSHGFSLTPILLVPTVPVRVQPKFESNNCYDDPFPPIRVMKKDVDFFPQASPSNDVEFLEKSAITSLLGLAFGVPKFTEQNVDISC